MRHSEEGIVKRPCLQVNGSWNGEMLEARSGCADTWKAAGVSSNAGMDEMLRNHDWEWTDAEDFSRMDLREGHSW